MPRIVLAITLLLATTLNAQSPPSGPSPFHGVVTFRIVRGDSMTSMRFYVADSLVRLDIPPLSGEGDFVVYDFRRRLVRLTSPLARRFTERGVAPDTLRTRRMRDLDRNLVPTDSTSQLAGLECRHYLGKTAARVTIDACSTNRLGAFVLADVLRALDNHQLDAWSAGRSDGFSFPMRIVSGGRLWFEVISVQATTVPPQLFGVPDGYRRSGK